MRADEFVVEGWADTAKGLGKGIASGIGNAASGMMNKVKDTDTDWLKGQLYRFGGGKFGQEGNIAATKNVFIKNFVQEYNQITKAAKQSGMDVPSLGEYVTDYLSQVGWNAQPTQVEKIIANSGDNIQNIANGVYAIGMMNMRSKSQNKDQNSNQPAAGNNPLSFDGKNLDPSDPADARLIQLYQKQHGQQAPTSNETPGGLPLDQAPTTDKILQTIEKMTGSSYADDLETIADHALANLFATNKGAYASARQAIITGKRKSETPQTGERIEPTMNESSRKTKDFSNRHK